MSITRNFIRIGGVVAALDEDSNYWFTHIIEELIKHIGR